MDTKWKRRNSASSAQLLRFAGVLATNPLIAIGVSTDLFSFNSFGTLLIFCAICSICAVCIVWMFVCTGTVQGSDEIQLGEMGKLPTEVLVLLAASSSLLILFILWKAFAFHPLSLYTLGTAGGGFGLLCLLALARKWKAGRLVDDMLLTHILLRVWHAVLFVLRLVRGAFTGHDTLDIHHPAGRAWVYRILWVCCSMAGMDVLAYLVLSNQLLGTGKGYWYGSGRYTAFTIFTFGVVTAGASYLIWRANRDARQFDALLMQIETAAETESSPVCVPPDSALRAASEAVASIGSHLRESVEAQIKSERMKLDLITNVSHDLKTPLTSIIGYLDLLEKQDGLPPEARDYVLILRRKSERLATTVSDLFTLAKATSGSETLNVEPLDLVMAVRQTLGDMNDAIRKAGIPVKAKMPASASVRADSAKLYRVLQNILDNALRYSLVGTRIYLDVIPGDIATRLTLQNTASYEMAFAPEEITQRFVRGDASRTTEGSGLGLSIAQTFMQNFGGNLAVEVRGDAFILTLTFPNGTSGMPAGGGECRVDVYGTEAEENVPELPEPKEDSKEALEPTKGSQEAPQKTPEPAAAPESAQTETQETQTQ